MIYSVKEAISSARQGDATAAKWLINEFCATVNENRKKTPEGEFKLTADGERIPYRTPSTHTQFDEALLDYLVECFEKIGSSIDDPGSSKRVNADVALNFAGFGKRGPKSSAKTREKSLQRGMALWRIHRGSVESLEKIFMDVAEAQTDGVLVSAELKNPSASTLERDYKEFKKLLKPKGK